MGMAPMKQQRKLQVLLSVSILSFLLSYYYSYTALLHKVHQFMNREAMLLFCNAILLFLAKDSGLLGSPVSADDHPCDEFGTRGGDHPSQKADDVTEIEELYVEEKATVVESVGALELVVQAGGGRDDQEGLMEPTDGVGVDEADETEQMGIEEWNRKFEEFIEKVKRERRMEALQLVVV